MNGFYSEEELEQIGFGFVGKNVSISKKASIYGANKMRIGNNVRIDDFAILIGNIEIGNYVHIGAYCGLHASMDGKIIFKDFSGISSNVTIYASSDSFDGEYMTGRPGIPDSCTNVVCDTIVLGKYSQVGTGSTLLGGGK
jgi:galactoside O-acetyltransferase